MNTLLSLNSTASEKLQFYLVRNLLNPGRGAGLFFSAGEALLNTFNQPAQTG